MDNQLMPFEGKEIRKIWHNGEWYFAAIDVIEFLVKTSSPRQYWTKVKNNLIGESQLQPFWLQLKMTAPDGKNRLTDCANTEGVFRIIMSVPSPKAEPLKLWLASVGKQAIEEAENPELLTERQAALYRAKGYTEEWIGRRIQTIETRRALTDEWKGRGVKENQEYSILTAVIAKGTFGLTPSEHKEVKGLERQNLRDHMTPLELIFTALGEEVTRQLAVQDNAQGFNENFDVASEGGRMAGKSMDMLESTKRLKVVSSDNFLGLKGNTDQEALLPEE
jgi:prophage antirepressor-like protein